MIFHSKTQELQKSQTVSVQGITKALQTEHTKEVVLLKSQGSEFVKKTDVGTCLMARDYKGFGNQAMNGVVEWKKIE